MHKTCLSIFGCKMCVLLIRPIKNAIFQMKNGETQKLVVGFLGKKSDTEKQIMEIFSDFVKLFLQPQRQTMYIVEDFACGAKTLHFAFFHYSFHVFRFDSFFECFFFFCLFFSLSNICHCQHQFQSLTVDVSSVVGAPWRCGVQTT